jgi:hypothetical protein
VSKVERREFIAGAIAAAGFAATGRIARAPGSPSYDSSVTPHNFTVTIRTGGQTGVDRAALDFAIQQKLPYAGWCPRGGWAEDHEPPLDIRTQYPRLTETPSQAERPRSLRQRTAWNTRDSHATLILVRSDALAHSPGTEFTRDSAELIFQRPCLVVDIARQDSLSAARDWLESTASGLGLAELVLNVAGPRESEDKGIYLAAKSFLSQMLAGERTAAGYALWLVPARDDGARIYDIINALADRFNTPRFPPHATLCSGEGQADLFEIKRAMDGLCGQLPKTRLAVEGIRSCNTRFTFFNIKLANDDSWDTLRRAAAVIPGSAPPDIGPHVSLMYSDRFSDIPRDKLEKEFRHRVPDRIVFDSVKLVTPGANGWQDVNRWEVKHTCQLL